MIDKLKRVKLKIHRSDVLLLLTWLLALLIISPFDEYPVNDDWAYAKNVYHLAVEKVFKLDTFPAMNLISQTIYGSCFASVFGFSFVLLRISIFVLAVVASLVLKRTIEKLNFHNQWLALFIVTIFFFNPLILELSFTFMTDVFFLSMVIFVFHFLVSYLQKEKWISYVFFILFCSITVLSRQHGLFISLLSISLLSLKKQKWKKILLVLLPPILTWLAHDKYRHYLTVYHVPHGIQYSNDFFRYFTNAPIHNHLTHAGDIIIESGLLLSPFLLILLLSVQLPSKKQLVYIIPFVFLTGYLVYYVWQFYPSGNITQVLQCGPRVVKTDYIERSTGWLETIRKFQMVIGGVSFCGVLILIAFKKGAVNFKGKFLPLSLKIIAIIFFVFISINDAYFNRYIIPFSFLLLVLMVPQENSYFNHKTGFIALVLAIMLFGISVIEVRDYFEWQNTRWSALNELNKKGITAEQLDGGFEYNGWYKPIEGWSEAGKSWWWVKDDEYVVSSQRLKNYQVEKKYAVIQILPIKEDTIFVLRRLNKK